MLFSYHTLNQFWYFYYIYLVISQHPARYFSGYTMAKGKSKKDKTVDKSKPVPTARAASKRKPFSS